MNFNAEDAEDAEEEFDEVSSLVIACAMRVHSALGPGLFEEVYRACLKHELSNSGASVLAEVNLPVTYNNVELEIGYRIDLLVNGSHIIELKSVERLASIHKAQLLTYLRLARKSVGLLLNFNSTHLRNGIMRVAYSSSPRRPLRPRR
jgi:GxxExxY protein